MRAVLQFYWLDLKDFFRNKLDYSAIAHRLCCLFSGLIVAYYLIMSIACFWGAWEDMELFSALGSSYSFGHHLIKNYFPEVVMEFLLLSTEFLFYIFLYNRLERMKHPIFAVWYFVAIILLHGCLLTHARTLNYPEFPLFKIAMGITRRYYRFICLILRQSIFYLVAYLLHLRDFPHRKK